MREVKFRGKRIDNGEWVYGFLWIYESIYRIEYYIKHKNEIGNLVDAQVDPKTVGQYTGLHDKNYVEIYEGDIIEIVDDPNHSYNIDMQKHDIGCIGYVSWNKRFTGYELIDSDGEEIGTNKWSIGNYAKSGAFNLLKVIGNIHENPELLR